MEPSGQQGVDRRSFLKIGGAGAALGLFYLKGAFSATLADEIASGEHAIEYTSPDDLYGE
ncbi:MAG: twin-arginine translocation signal domain-containing protein, partial [Pseudomonadales bacterium]